ncbi:uncharacterized protein LOC117537302 isoform X2 [Gymnodraco acuticeps]|nr:uncharacterized protein LOC117537302 isoform X2 [Gymnodraco acuticeps]
MPHIKTLEVLNDCNESQQILMKLPDWLVSGWNRKAMEARHANGGYPPFKVFVDFISKEADLACDPISSIQAIRSVESEKTKNPISQTIQAKTLSTNTTQSSIPTCIFCKGTGHVLPKCRKFVEKTVEDRIKFVYAERLCFGCLNTGHQSKACNDKSTCEKCQRRHPTCLHDDKFKGKMSTTFNGDDISKDKTDTKEIAATTNRVIQEGPSTQTSAIIPVWVSSTKQPEQEVLVYALLDTQSDTTFILDEVAQNLDTNKENVRLRLSTMSTKSTVIPCQKLTELQVRGYDLEKMIPLPPLFTREFIPVDRSHIPTSETALKWPHLEQLADKIPPPLDCEVGLLIGYNCQQALLPREILSGKDNYPYAQRTDLGWSIVGCSNPAKDYCDTIGTSHRIVVRQVTPAVQPAIQLKREVHFELSSAVTSVRNGDVIKRELEIENLQEYYWTDSKVVLGYLNNDAKSFHTFVANRIQRIRSSTNPEQWRHVSSENNPADYASRGLSAVQLKESNWLKGPDFLFQLNLPCEEKVRAVETDDPELRKVHVHTVKTKEENSLLNRFSKFSDWSRTVRAVARLKRFVRESRRLQPRTNEATNLAERREAEIFIIKLVQEEAFTEEIKTVQLQKGSTLNKHNKLHLLNAFLDKNNVLRVGGRLSQSALHHDIKHPAILPKKAHVSALLVKHHHERVHHQGRGMTMNEVRANGIWILGCGNVVSSHIYKCVKCRKYRRTTETQQMADLPEDRTETSTPFTYCGIDCFGPFIVKEGRKEVKRYGLLFTCLCSRAVHIETLDDLTTDAFMNALRTMVAIRGPVRQLRCDQGTNFIGAKREFSELLKGMDQERQRAIGCEFVMNVPSASHMGGVWERQIRTIRSILTVMLDKSASRLDTTTLRTFLYETMAIINSRPLSVEHLHDLTGPEPLTPNHIITMKSSVILPPPGEFCKEDLYLRKRWRRVQFLANEFWRRWKREYLLNLQQRQKWPKASQNSQVDDIVILRDDNLPRNEWKLARVVETHPGTDGLVRKLKLLVSNTTLDKGKPHTRLVYLERPIHKVVTLLQAT